MEAARRRLRIARRLGGLPQVEPRERIAGVPFQQSLEGFCRGVEVAALQFEHAAVAERSYIVRIEFQRPRDLGCGQVEFAALEVRGGQIRVRALVGEVQLRATPELHGVSPLECTGVAADGARQREASREQRGRHQNASWRQRTPQQCATRERCQEHEAERRCEEEAFGEEGPDGECVGGRE